MEKTQKKLDIKDYLHLYIGQKVLCSGFEFIGEPLVDVIATIDSVHQECVTFVTDNGISVGDYYFDDPEFNIKLLLRKLSDMTEEDSIELFKRLSNFDLSECVFDIMDDEEEFTINAEHNGRVVDSMSMSVNSDIVSMMNNGGSFDPVNPQSEAFRFFLSKGFDLFGLIDAELAIDSKTLNS